jgi:hypothetical protein
MYVLHSYVHGTTNYKAQAQDEARAACLEIVEMPL